MLRKRAIAGGAFRAAVFAAAAAALHGCRLSGWFSWGEEPVLPPDNALFYETAGTGAAQSGGAGGKFRPDAAASAYREMAARFSYAIPSNGAPCSLQCTDFRLGRFARTGAGIWRWANEIREEYSACDIFLLPCQGTPELRIEKTVATATDSASGRKYAKDVPCKTSTWLVRRGTVYAVFSAGKPNIDEFPGLKDAIALQTSPRTCTLPPPAHVEMWQADGCAHKLPADETRYFFIAGPEGAIISETSNYHAENGVKHSLRGAAF